MIGQGLELRGRWDLFRFVLVRLGVVGRSGTSGGSQIHSRSVIMFTLVYFVV